MGQFKSIERCEIDLAPVTILVGRNGVGKSNLVDSLRFITDALRATLEYAIRDRGGINQVRRKSLGGRPTNPGIGVAMTLPDGRTGDYGFRIAAAAGGAFSVSREACRIWNPAGSLVHEFETKEGQIIKWSPKSEKPATVNDRLLLVAASGLAEFRPVYDGLTHMAFHNLNPENMKYPQRPAPGDLLANDGRNIASVVKRLESASPNRLARVTEFLKAMGVPISRVSHKQAGALETIEVAQVYEVPTGDRNALFDAIALSDGTIRALGLLISLISSQASNGTGTALVGIEEPETALHPAATAALMDGLLEGAEETQLLITCHSPDLLDHSDIAPEMIRPVLLDNGRTVVGRLSERKVELLQKHLSTAGELLRLDQLEPDPDDLKRQAEATGTLWEGPP